ncbi:hypothetical protein D3C85_1644580 [compost metagenome]
MAVHGGVNAADLVALLAVEIQRRRHHGAADVLGLRVVLQPVGVVHHLFEEQRLGRARLIFAVFLLRLRNPQRPLEQLPHRDEVAF